MVIETFEPALTHFLPGAPSCGGLHLTHQLLTVDLMLTIALKFYCVKLSDI